MPTTAQFEKMMKKRRGMQSAKPSLSLSMDISIGPKVKKKEVTEFTRQLSTMVSARLPLARSLEILAKQHRNKHFKAVVQDLLAKVQGGKSLSDSFACHPKLFIPLYVNMLRVGEIGGNMAELLSQLALYLEKMSGLKRKLLTAMTYPSIIVFISIGALSFLMFGVMPIFTDMFLDFNAEMPPSAVLLIGISDFIGSNIIYILIGAGILIILFRAFAKTEKGIYFVDWIKLKTPLIGGILKKVYIARFSRTLSTLLKSGVSLLEALDVTSQSVGHSFYQRTIVRMKHLAEKGESIEKSISDTKLFPELVIQMIAVGEETAELPSMLMKSAEFYEAEIDASIEALTSIIEPIIIFGLGIVLGGIIITIYMQIFELMNVIQ